MPTFKGCNLLKMQQLKVHVNSVAALENLREYRKSRKESQCLFWSRFGVTQTRGSRFETGLKIPLPIAILLKLYLEGKITDGDLWHAKRRSDEKNIKNRLPLEIDQPLVHGLD